MQEHTPIENADASRSPSWMIRFATAVPRVVLLSLGGFSLILACWLSYDVLRAEQPRFTELTFLAEQRPVVAEVVRHQVRNGVVYPEEFFGTAALTELDAQWVLQRISETQKKSIIPGEDYGVFNLAGLRYATTDEMLKEASKTSPKGPFESWYSFELTYNSEDGRKYCTLLTSPSASRVWIRYARGYARGYGYFTATVREPKLSATMNRFAQSCFESFEAAKNDWQAGQRHPFYHWQEPKHLPPNED